MISVRQSCRNRLEDVTNLSYTILLPIVVQVYEFHEFHRKSEKVEKEKALNHHKEESNKKGCVGKFKNLQRDNYHAHSTGTFRTQSNI